MRTLVLAMVMVLGCGRSAPTAAPVPPDAARGRPKLVFAKTSLAFGEVVAGVLPMEFPYRNEGTADLHLGAIQVSCGCTAAKPSAEVVPPNGSGTLKVSFDGKQSNGPVSKTVTVASDDPEHPSLTLSFTATVLPLLDYEPRAIHLIVGDRTQGTQKISFRGVEAPVFKPRALKLTGEAGIEKSVKARFLREGRPARAGLELKLTAQATPAGQGLVEFETGLAEPAQMAIAFSWGR